jgi:regulator of replication initiation timing
LESELAVLQRELASIRSSAERSAELSSRLELESDELKGRIESAKYEEERDRKKADDIEEGLTELAEEVNAQLDELERINGGGGGMGMAVGRAMKSLTTSSRSIGDALSVGGRSRASSGGDSIVDELEIRLQGAALSAGDGNHANSDDELDMTFADDISLRSNRSSGLEELRSVSTGRATSRTRREPSEMQKQWEATYKSPAGNLDRSTSRGSGGDSNDRKERYIDNSRLEEGSPTRSGNMKFPESANPTSSRAASSGGRSNRAASHTEPSKRAASHASRQRSYQSETTSSRRGNPNSAADMPSSVRNITQSFGGLLRSLGQEVDND